MQSERCHSFLKSVAWPRPASLRPRVSLRRGNTPEITIKMPHNYHNFRLSLLSLFSLWKLQNYSREILQKTLEKIQKCKKGINLCLTFLKILWGSVRRTRKIKKSFFFIFLLGDLNTCKVFNIILVWVS